MYDTLWIFILENTTSEWVPFIPFFVESHIYT